MNLLKMENIEKSFDNEEVIKNISLEINKGEVLVIIGPSGSGKSTLIRCATNLEKINKGNILYGDEYLAQTINSNVKYAEGKELKEINKKFGMVFQDYNLFPHLSVLENVVLAPNILLEENQTSIEKRALKLLNDMGLDNKKDMYPYQLSGGQQQRASIARALTMEPSILFFDEPTSALDPELTEEVLDIIKNLSKEGYTMVIVTHEMDFALNVADKIIFMDKGYIVEEGKPEELINNPQKERTKKFLKRR